MVSEKHFIYFIINIYKRYCNNNSINSNGFFMNLREQLSYKKIEFGNKYYYYYYELKLSKKNYYYCDIHFYNCYYRNNNE